MAQNICIFEDNRYARLLPLAYTRAGYELLCGMDSIMRKIIRKYPRAQVNLFCRDYLRDVIRGRYKLRVNSVIKDECLFINGRLLIDAEIPLTGKEELGVMGDTLVYARLGKEQASIMKAASFIDGRIIKQLSKSVKVRKIKCRLVDYLWNVVHSNSEQIEKDFRAVVKQGIVKGEVCDGVHIINKKLVHIGKGARIMPGVVINAEAGPVYIDDGVTVMPNAVIEGPVYIGRNSMIKACARIYKGTSIGEECKVGGEVEESIIHSYSNKQHEGFLGHSYIGKWVNLGAATDNSDLKNNYSNVRVYVEGKSVDSGSMFVGMFIGDYTKTGIGAKIYSGSVAGIMCNILGTGIPKEGLESFAWEKPDGTITTHVLKKGIETARSAMKRRKLRLSRAEERMIENVFKAK